MLSAQGLAVKGQTGGWEMSGQICGMCGRLIAVESKAGWTSIAGFAALYCESCLRAHAQEFPSARVVTGKSARQEIGARPTGGPAPKTARVKYTFLAADGSSVSRDEYGNLYRAMGGAKQAGAKPAAAPTTYLCGECGAPATHEVCFAGGWRARCKTCIKQWGFASARPIAPAPAAP